MTEVDCTRQLPALALRRVCVFFVIGAGGRYARVLGVTSRPDGAWATRRARNLLMGLGERAARFRFGDRAGQFTGAVDAVLSGAGIGVARIPPRSPSANAYAERRVGAVRAEASGRMLITGPGHVRRVSGEYVAHYNRHRPHRAGNLRPPDWTGTTSSRPRSPAWRRRDYDVTGSSAG